ncbi:MAG TPA: type II toxin-antitoxin system VapC family toxin [Stellaceae bacterium]|nr:type II toxin-antitoxin system VapC family toxin [Stellaceae bacterium]
MSRGWLLDTNVVSELFKGERADAGLRAWADSTSEDRLYLSALTLGEISKRLCLAEARGRDMRPQRRFLEHDLPDRFGERILAFDAAAAVIWGRLMAGLRGDRVNERRLVIDGQIAATAEAASLDVCSRNVRDFAALGITSILNPFVQP